MSLAVSDRARHMDGIRRAIDETLTRAASGRPGAFVHAAGYLLGIPAARRSPLESERTALLYFLSNHAGARRGRGERDGDAAGSEVDLTVGLAGLSNEEVTELCDYAVEHPLFEAAAFAVRRLQEALFGG